jgi:hypothetical protein
MRLKPGMTCAGEGQQQFNRPTDLEQNSSCHHGSSASSRQLVKGVRTEEEDTVDFRYQATASEDTDDLSSAGVRS